MPIRLYLQLQSSRALLQGRGRIRLRRSAYHEDIFISDGCTVASQKTAICCLAAVAAIRVQYNGDDFDVGTDRVFYDVARHFFENLIEEQPLDAIKAYALLAIYNIINKAPVSFAYIGLWFHNALVCSLGHQTNFILIDIGLSVSKRHSLNERFYHHPGLSHHK